MLPLLELKLTATAAPYQDPVTDEWACSGYSVAYLMERLRGYSAPLAENLDETGQKTCRAYRSLIGKLFGMN
jgi:hypothetical protein